ncbi:MAG: PhoU domain-containing protein [Candidatus Kaelpia aquatica]|nr:PhoU domain-containing protein [Candidatus Kaelpia aquatica]
MFETLIKIWKKKNLLPQVFDEFQEILVNAHEMFDSVCKKLIDNEEVPSLRKKIYEIDENINRLQKDIRTKVVEHLIFQPAVDVSVCLLLMSVVKDAERLGDYCKNLLEVVYILGKPIDKKKYLYFFDVMDKKISELFKKTKEAFIESDEKKSITAWDYETKIVKRCDEIVEELAKSSLSINEGVCLTLIARYFKRLTAHLTNIATSVVLPISELDHYDEGRRKESVTD